MGGRSITRDNVPPQRLYKVPKGKRPTGWPDSPSSWPTAPLCVPCREQTQEAEAELFEAMVVQSGGHTAHWKKYIADHAATPHWGQLAQRAGWVEVHGQRRRSMTFSSTLLGACSAKLASSLWWVLRGERLSPNATCRPVAFLDDSAWDEPYAVGPWFEVLVREQAPTYLFAVRYFQRAGILLLVRLPE